MGGWNLECCGCKGASADAGNAATSLVAAAAPAEGLGALAVPAWCTYVPVGIQQAACRGSSAQGCKCSDFCKDQPANTQGWNPECCGCKGASAEAGKLVAAAAPGVGLGALAVPAWCIYVPVGLQQAACRGSSGQGCKCSNFCKDHPANTQGWNPECCGCSGASSVGVSR